MDIKGRTATRGLGTERPGLERPKTVKHEMRMTVELGDLIQAVFDEAARHRTNPQEVSRLATQAAAQMLYRHLLRQTRPEPTHDAN